MTLIQKIPFVRFLIPLTLGITVAIETLYRADNQFWITIVLVTSCVLFVLIKPIRTHYQTQWIYGLLVYACFFWLGFTNVAINEKLPQYHFSKYTHKGQYQKTIGKIVHTPKTKSKTIGTTVELQKIKQGKKWKSCSGSLYVYFEKSRSAKTLKFGDIVIMHSTINDIAAPKNPNEFNFKRYMSHQHINHQTFVKQQHWKLLTAKNNFSIKGLSSHYRQQLLQQLRNNLPKTIYPVASALLIGYKDELHRPIKEAYIDAGVIHILTVSGLHVGIIFLMLSHLLSFMDKLPYGRMIKSLILILLLWTYALLTGLSNSTCRATIMFSIIVLASAKSKPTNIFNTIAISAFCLLLYNPFNITNVGFQLSYLAVLGIVVIQPMLYQLLKLKYWLANKIWEITTVSIAAQIATLPVTLYYFHQFPNYFIISNLLVTPLIIPIIFLGVMSLVSAIIPLINIVSYFLLEKMVFLLNLLVITLQQLPNAVTENISFSFSSMLLLYLLIALLILYFQLKKYIYLFMAHFICILILLLSTFNHWKQRKQKMIVVYDIPQHSAIDFIDGKSNILFGDKKLLNDFRKIDYHIQNNWISLGIKNTTSVELVHTKTPRNEKHWFQYKNYLQFYDYKIAFVDQPLVNRKNDMALPVNLVVIKNAPRIPLSTIVNKYPTKTVLLDHSVPLYYAKKIKQEAEQLGINIWDVRNKGYFSHCI